MLGGASLSWLLLNDWMSSGVQGRDWQRLWDRGGALSQGVGLHGSGRGGKVKVREMTDLLGVSKSLIRPPLRSCLWEKGLMRAGVLWTGDNASDLLRHSGSSTMASKDDHLSLRDLDRGVTGSAKNKEKIWVRHINVRALFNHTDSMYWRIVLSG